MDFFVAHNPFSDLKRRATKRQEKRTPNRPTIRPILDTSSGIIAIPYAGTDDSSASSTPTSEKSDSSFNETPDSPTSVIRPSLPKRSASRATTTKSVTFDGARTSTVPGEASSNSDTVADMPPPIPPKSPYRASRLMVQLQRELAETPEEEIDEERSFYREDDDDRWSVRTV